MESLDKIVHKMEELFAFATGDSYNRLALIKNLEKVMTSLLRNVKREIGCSTSSMDTTPFRGSRRKIVFCGRLLCCLD